jgi:hypothetical protein
VFNHLYYGGWALTSYSSVHGWYPLPAFSLRYAYGPSFIDGYSLNAGIENLWHNFGIFLPLAFIGWFRLGRAGHILAYISLAIFGLHTIYAFAPTGINARFLIPIFPIVAIGAAIAIITILAKVPQFPRLVLASILFVVAVWQLPDTVQESVHRNQTSTQHVKLVQSITSTTPTNAVFMSYPWNDLFAVYGNRSVFNYRRVAVSDPALQQYRTKEAVPVIIEVISTVLKHNQPVYFVNSSNNFINDLPAIFNSHFLVETLIINDMTVYKLDLPTSP